MVTAVIQTGVVLLSGSVALLADTIHNFADAATAIPLGVAFWLARRGATPRFTYGLGRVEDLAGLAIIVTILASAIAATYAAIHRLLHPEPVALLWAVMVASVIGFVGNEAVAVFRIRVGRQIGSSGCARLRRARAGRAFGSSTSSRTNAPTSSVGTTHIKATTVSRRSCQVSAPARQRGGSTDSDR